MTKITKPKRRTAFVQIDKRGLQDKGLSWKAKGLLAYLLTLPPDWQIYIRELQKHATDGRDSTASALKELMVAKYVIKTRKHRPNGTFQGYTYQVLDTPHTENGKPAHGYTENGFSENGLTVYGLSENGKPVTNNNIQEVIIESNNKEQERENAPEEPNQELKKEIPPVPSESTPPERPISANDFFAPNKHEKAAEEVIKYLTKNQMYLNGIAAGDWKRAVKGHCLKLQSTGKWNELTIPKTEGQYFSWIGSRIAGTKSWFIAAAEIDKKRNNGSRTKIPRGSQSRKRVEGGVAERAKGQGNRLGIPVY